MHLPSHLCTRPVFFIVPQGLSVSKMNYHQDRFFVKKGLPTADERY